MLQGRGVRALWGSGVLLAAVWACETARNPAGIQRDLTPPTISLTKAPPDTQDISAGLTFSVSATDNLGLKDIRLPYTRGYIPLTDTVFFFPGSVDFVASVLVSGASGFFTLAGFAVDSGFRVASTPPVTVNILSVVNDLTPPQVEHFVPLRAEVGDTVTVHATDPSGISKIGFIVTDLTGATVLAADSIGVPPLPATNLSGKATDVVHTFSMKSPGITTFPTQVVVHGFAVDGAVAFNRGVSGATFTTISPSGPAKLDTITLVAGVTRSFPLGGHIADAIFNANLNELYLTNPSRHRVEIFQVATSRFVANPIAFGVGVPWGIALWPRDTLGAYGDTIVVADAGGTQLAIVDVRPAGRRPQWRQDLPNFLIGTYKVVTSQGGGNPEEITLYDGSERPQCVAPVCRPAAGTACSTDRSYARNSGNFKHAFFGEGGSITTSFARVMAYDANRLLQTGVFQSCISATHSALASGFNDVDFGMSPGVNVSDFISNTGIHVSSVATNFNGLTNVVRADSIYYLDSNLRLKATSCTLGVGGVGCVTGSPAMDMDYFHDFSPGGSCTPTCGGGTNVNNRLLFAARPDASIDVFDTFDGSQILSGGLPVTIPIRDPIIGPLRVAKDATGQLLFGITAKGLVMVRLPALVNPNPAPPRR